MRNKILVATILLALIGNACATHQTVHGARPFASDNSAHNFVRSALKLDAAGDYRGAAEQFRRAAEESSTADLRRRSLAAAALSHLKAGDREKFLEMEGRLEEDLTEFERRLPPRELADTVALGRIMRGDTPPPNTSAEMSRLLFELRLDQ